MKISMERGALLKAIGQAQSVVERRNTIPILANVLIEAEGETVRCRATDLDIEVIDSAPAQVEKAGGITVSAVMLHEIIRKLPDGALVSLSEEDQTGRLIIVAGRSTFYLASLPRAEFPVLASSEYSCGFEVQSHILRRLLDKTKFAISNEETRYYLNGVFIQSSHYEGTPVLRTVATDGHRLARVDAPLPAGAENMPEVIIPRKTVNELRKLLADDDVTIKVSVSNSKIRFETPSVTLSSKVVDGKFPDYTRVIPQVNARRLAVDAGDFARAVDRVATVSAEKTRAVKLTIDEDRLVLSVHAPDSGMAEEELPAAYSDEKMETGFNAKYLHEIAGQIDRENMVMWFNNAADPVLIYEGDDVSAAFVIMPMRV